MGHVPNLQGSSQTHLETLISHQIARTRGKEEGRVLTNLESCEFVGGCRDEYAIFEPPLGPKFFGIRTPKVSHSAHGIGNVCH